LDVLPKADRETRTGPAKPLGEKNLTVADWPLELPGAMENAHTTLDGPSENAIWIATVLADADAGN
jgi:hypothetical protein